MPSQEDYLDNLLKGTPGKSLKKGAKMRHFRILKLI